MHAGGFVAQSYCVLPGLAVGLEGLAALSGVLLRRLIENLHCKCWIKGESLNIGFLLQIMREIQPSVDAKGGQLMEDY